MRLNLMDCTRITGTGLKELAKLQQLKTLTVGDSVPFTSKQAREDAAALGAQNPTPKSKITDASLKEVGKLQKLTGLKLASFQVTLSLIHISEPTRPY